MNNILNYSLKKIENSIHLEKPWEHFIIDDFLEKSFYNELKKDFDSLNWFHDNKGKYRNEWRRSKIRIYQGGKNEINKPSFTKLINLFKNEKFAKSVVNKFKKIRCKEYPNNIWIEMDTFIKDFSYRIHFDSKPKYVTFLIYLPDDENDPQELGTKMYDKKKEFVKNAPYNKNTCFIFAPNDDITWHSMDYKNINNNDVKRKSIQIFYKYGNKNDRSDVYIGAITNTHGK